MNNMYIYAVDIQSGSHIDGVGDLYDEYPEMVKDINEAEFNILLQLISEGGII